MAMKNRMMRKATPKGATSAKKDLELVKRMKLGYDPRAIRLGLHRPTRMAALKTDPKVVALVEELKRSAGTPQGVALRREIIAVISNAKAKVMRGMARPSAGKGFRSHGKK